MWPFKKKNNYQVYFTCEDWAIRKYTPVAPARSFLPPAFKNMQAYVQQERHHIDSIKTVKSCPGIGDFCSAGFVIPAWCDIEIIPDASGNFIKTRYSHPKFKEGYHPSEMLQGFLSNKFSVKTAIKLDNPWLMWAAQGYSLLYQPMYYYDDSRNWEALPGWIDQDMATVSNPIPIMLKENKVTLIKAGEPIVQVIPIKRENVTAYTGAVNNTTIERYNGLSYLHNMTFGGWLKHIRTKKSYTVDAHDVELPNN